MTHEESRTGAPKVVYEVAREMNKYYNVKMVSLNGGSMHKEFESEFGKIIYESSLFDCRQIIINEKPDLVYVNSLSSYRYAIEARKFGIPAVFHIHELRGGFDAVFNQRELEMFKEYADRYIVVSKPVEKILLKDLLCDPSKVFMLNAFVNSEDIINKSLQGFNEIKEKIIQNDKIIVIGIGYFNTRKGDDYFINAFKILNKKYPNRFRFIWIGKYGVSSWLRSWYSVGKNLGNDFLLLGERENPYPYLRSADIFLLSSREDPFPLVALEAMALKKPVVAFKEGGGIPEAISGCGVIVENMNSWFLADSIQDLSKDFELMKNLGEKASLRLKLNYDSKIILPKIKKLIDDLLLVQI